MKARTLFILAIGVLATGALGVVAFRTDPVPVDLQEVVSGAMQVTVNVDGRTRISEVYEVAAPIAGTAQRIPVRVGDAVVAGETVVAVVEPASSGLLDTRTRLQAEAAVREAEAGLFVARSALRQAEEELTLTQSEYDRARQLVERGVASLTRLETAEQSLAVRQAAEQAAVSNLERAKSALDRARAALVEPTFSTGDSPDACCLRVTAPVNGRVLDIDVISERPVLAGTRLLSIGDPADLEIVADVLSIDAVLLEPGDRAIVERWGGPYPLEARIAKIEPAGYTKVSALGIEEQRVDVILTLETPLQDRSTLGDGFSVFLRIVEWEADDVLKVPLSAVFRQGEAELVFVERSGKAELRVVETGRSNSSHAQVLSGLEAGDMVIVHPNERVEDGVAIQIRDNM